MILASLTHSTQSLYAFDGHSSRYSYTTYLQRRAAGENRHWDTLRPWNSTNFPIRISRSIGSSKNISVYDSGKMHNGRTVCLASEEKTSMFRWPDSQRPRICILGGGFGGLYTALRLESLIWPDDKKPQVLLIDQSERFVFKPMLYELLSGEVDVWEIAPLFLDLLTNTTIRFIQDKVKWLHPSDHLSMEDPRKLHSGGTVHLESGIIVEYDWLVLALGAESKLDGVPGAAEFALPFSTLEDALKLDKILKSLERQKFGQSSGLIRVAVVGCGYSGVELAATISKRLGDKGVIQAIHVGSSICPTAPHGNREAASKVLSSQNIELFLGYFVSNIRESSKTEDLALAGIRDQEQIMTEPRKHCREFLLDLQPSQRVRGVDRQTLAADLVLWTVGTKPLASQVGVSNETYVIPLNGRGQTETDETLRVKGHPRIFAIGDSAASWDSSGVPIPSTAQVAFQQADFTGWNLWAAINNQPLLPFRFQNLGEMITLGRAEAAVTPSFLDSVTLDGPFGHAARKMAYLLRMPTEEHRLKVGLSWLAKSAVDSIATLQTTVTQFF